MWGLGFSWGFEELSVYVKGEYGLFCSHSGLVNLNKGNRVDLFTEVKKGSPDMSGQTSRKRTYPGNSL